MLTLRTNLITERGNDELGEINITLSNINYDRILDIVLPIALEKVYKKLNQSDADKQLNKLLSPVVELLYQSKNYSMNAVRAAVDAFPDSLKEEIIVTALDNPEVCTMLNELIKKRGLKIGTLKVERSVK